MVDCYCEAIVPTLTLRIQNTWTKLVHIAAVGKADKNDKQRPRYSGRSPNVGSYFAVY